MAADCDEVIEQCIRLECICCNWGMGVESFPNDNNLYHPNGSPCRAYRIRRHYNTLTTFEDKFTTRLAG